VPAVDIADSDGVTVRGGTIVTLASPALRVRNVNDNDITLTSVTATGDFTLVNLSNTHQSSITIDDGSLAGTAAADPVVFVGEGAGPVTILAPVTGAAADGTAVQVTERKGGVVTIGSVTHNGSGGTAFEAFRNFDGDIVVGGDVDALGTGVSIHDNTGGKVTVNGAIGGALDALTAVSIAGNTDMTSLFNGAVTANATTGAAISITDNEHGTSTFTGPVTANLPAGVAIAVSDNPTGSTDFTGPVTISVEEGIGVGLNNTGSDPLAHSVTFSGGLDISTASVNDTIAVSAFNAGTLEVLGADNTIDAAGTAILSLGTAMGPNGITFKSIDARGVLLSGTGPLGTFRITGDGAAGSGGTIELSALLFLFQPSGLVFGDVNAVDLNNVVVRDTVSSGIAADGVASFTLTDSSVTDAGNDANPGNGVDLRNVAVATLTNNTVTGSGSSNVLIAHTSAPSMSVDIHGGHYSANEDLANVHVHTELDGLRVTVQDATFSDSTGDHLSVDGDAQTPGDTSRLIVTGSTFDTATGNGILLNPHASTELRASISGNTITNSGLAGVYVRAEGDGASSQTARADVSITNNTFGTSGVANSASATSAAILVSAPANSLNRLHVTGNTIHDVGPGRFGIEMEHTDTTGRIDATVTSNDITTTSAGSRGIGLTSTSAAGGGECWDVGGAGDLANDITAPSTSIALLRSGSAVIVLPGSPAGGIITFVASRNHVNNLVIVSGNAGAYASGPACTLPTPP
jgi:hypothetical protein